MNNRQQGYSIVELMIALTIGLMLLSSALAYLIDSLKTHKQIQQQSQLNENSQLAMALLINDIANSRFWLAASEYHQSTGSIDLAALTTGLCDESTIDWAADLNSAFSVSSNAENLQCIKNDDYLQGDIIHVRYTQPWQASFVNKRLYSRILATQIKLFNGDQQATNQLNNSLVEQLVAHSFFIAQSNDKCQQRDIPALYWQRSANGLPSKEELIQGVEDIKIIIAVDSNNDGNIDGYRQQFNDIDWRQVKLVEVHMITRTLCPYFSQPTKQQFHFAGQEITINDRYLRKYTLNNVLL
ncbi:PilW family protein [Thalassotalea maritima]|uniref:PilW family protein n=1 Tax=Thalassotalea maritima TaxID=3242416 RepID=UPI0035288BFC